MRKEVCQVVYTVRRLIDLENAELGVEFFPKHLSVALIDAVFTPRLRYEIHVVPLIQRYCRHFGLERTRLDRQRLPPIEEQETLKDLISHYQEYGLDRMQEEVFSASYCSPGTSITKAENVHRAAVELRNVGINTLQDAAGTHPEMIKCALRPLKGIGSATIHMFLMYVGNDDFVKGDVHVCRFVARALCREKVPPNEAEGLIREAARELCIAPRLLDNVIWKWSSQAP